ncbi:MULTISPECIES: ABC transporter ATP-binding protein [Burkholderiales]|jgi:branched-chain amino acid transport system ATP-binding protein|uniref:ABC transporter ATP-binding protein n=1 Tax=Burkholderiales TaxID=80840 RepID=UPI001214D177|nr:MULTISPECIES: ABC transporter ATP-binding protein [Burkholderiales]TAM48756.1 MAG: ABC transporter ATP-binding protein [Paraburkholderia sp.]TBR71592.1 MAG: ABC transporter ATP-binding protein [Burkholderiaceae bacterium]NOV27849.1 ABC transporter ATP-binding protein [Cupriavidus necator]NSX13998.1 ABC transporter ATP-binding protein [Cupriavidus taiwanensis]QHE78680.1 ABC transporter ATP-binding protein [Hydrogenophaga sp. PBL-H3]
MLLELNGLSAHFGKKQVLHQMSLSVGEGEVVALIGPNAAGKSTTMRCILGLKATSAGSIAFHGRCMDALGTPKRVREGLVLVPEGRQVFTEFSVLDNLLMGAYHRPDRGRIDGDLAKVFGLFPRLAERRAQKAGSMSGGEQQMLAIARGLMSRPRLLFMDEPSLGLAPIVMEEIASAIRHLAAGGLSILLAEQNASFALRMADRAYVIESGSVVLSGTAQELSDEPRVRHNYLGY